MNSYVKPCLGDAGDPSAALEAAQAGACAPETAEAAGKGASAAQALQAVAPQRGVDACEAACERAGQLARAVASLDNDVPIFLIGMMGAGKTTIGRGLARALGREFIDLDHELEARCGVRVQMIFEIEGEPGFRRRESTALAECARRPRVVLATGGGAILAPENRQVLRENGIVVYLRASVDELYRRTCRDRSRPLLATADPRATLRDLLTQRDPLYREVADLIIDTGCASVASLVKSILPPLATVQKHL